MTGLVHEYSASIEAAPERIFAALTTPSELQSWFAEEVTLEAMSGGVFRFSGRGAYAPTTGKVTRIERPTLIALAYPVEGADGEVTITLEPDPEKAGTTKLALKHTFAEAPKVARA